MSVRAGANHHPMAKARIKVNTLFIYQLLVKVFNLVLYYASSHYTRVVFTAQQVAELC
jgi:hypothetical protein